MTKIEWTQAAGYKGESWNPVVGCSKVSEGCRNCYAERMAGRLATMGNANYQAVTRFDEGRGLSLPQWSGSVRTVPEALDIPLRWRRPRMVFTGSMSDLFHRDVPFEFIDKVFALMALCPQHTFQLLTKRPERMAEYLKHVGLSEIGPKGHLCPVWHGVLNRADSAGLPGPRDLWYTAATRRGAIPNGPLPNVWLLTSAEDQPTLDLRVKWLLQCPAAVRGLSLEPLLGGIRIWEKTSGGALLNKGPVSTGRGIDWAIVGCESRGNRVGRCADGYWPAARSIIEQCREAGVACFHKQAPVWRCPSCRNCWQSRPEWPADECNDCPERARLVVSHDPAEWLPYFRVRQWPRLGGAGC